MKLQPNNFCISDYLHHTFDCDCGQQHSTALQEVVIQRGAIDSLPRLVANAGCHRVMVVCDRHTYEAAGRRVEQVLADGGISCLLHLLEAENVVPDEQVLGKLLMAHTPDIDLLVAVGTGTINDICKYLSHHLRLPYMVVASAPSMDGFASVGAALITDHLKTTYDTHVPLAIIGDVEVLKNAPMEMITAGLGDILGKYTCLADWKLAHIVTGEYYCPVIVQMVENSIQKVVDNAQKVLQRDEDAIAAIMEALVLTGIAMSFVGNSRPASGSEHHISHYWEMRFLFDGRTPVLHGTKVGIGAVLSCYLYSRLHQLKPDFAAARQIAQDFDYESWKAAMHRTFLQAADGVIALEQKTQKNGLEGHAKRLAVIEERWDDIVEMIAQSVPPTNVIIKLLAGLGAPVYPVQEQVDNQMVHDGILVAKEVRDRYTILQLLWDLGLAEQEADDVIGWLEQQTAVAQ